MFSLGINSSPDLACWQNRLARIAADPGGAFIRVGGVVQGAAKHGNHRRGNQWRDSGENALNRLAMAAVSVY
jgi:hypothetical protein